MNRKALGIAFISGVLLCGLGGGVAFGQYSKLEYAGERKIGEENLVTETFESQIEGDGKIYVDAYAAWEGRRLAVSYTHLDVYKRQLQVKCCNTSHIIVLLIYIYGLMRPHAQALFSLWVPINILLLSE